MSIEIKIEFCAGADINDCAAEIVTMAVRLDCGVFGYFNGVHVFANKNTRVASIVDIYHKELGRKAKPEPKTIWVNEMNYGKSYAHDTKQKAIDGADDGTGIKANSVLRCAVEYQEVIQ